MSENSAHKTRSGHQILWKWSWRWSLTTMRILGLESRSSEGATTNFNCWAISPALVFVFKSPLPFYKDLLMSIAITTLPISESSELYTWTYEENWLWRWRWFYCNYTDKKKTSGALQKTLSQFSLSAIYLNYFSQGKG